MDLSFTSEQELLQDSAVKFAQKACGLDQYRKSLEATGQCDPAIWSQMADFGWLALSIPESAGGLGGSSFDAALVAEALGAGLVVEPFVAGAFFPVAVLSAAGQANRHESLLAELASGETQMAVACNERQGRFDIRICESRAEHNGDGFVLSGKKHCVFNAPNASQLIVSARLDDKIQLFLVRKDADGIGLHSYPVMGGGVAADLLLDKVALPSSALVGGLEALDAGQDRAIAVACAQALGGMTALIERTINYLRTRKQFGVPIGSFQALQHRVVDMFIEAEQARSMVMMAAAKVDSDDPVVRARAASAAKAYLCKASKLVGQQAVQLHGGIGMTEELDVGHYFRQLTAFHTRFGDRDFHLSRFSELPA